MRNRRHGGIEILCTTTPMSEVTQRMIDGARKPDTRCLSAWIGKANYRRWTQILQYIESSYPGVFVPEWLFGGKKHGWGLRLKKSRSFCTLIPERNRLLVLIVFGGAERKKAESILEDLGPDVRHAYIEAPTYHDGKWFVLSVGRDEVLEDVWKLLALKRRPKKAETESGNQSRARVPR